MRENSTRFFIATHLSDVKLKMQSFFRLKKESHSFVKAKDKSKYRYITITMYITYLKKYSYDMWADSK